MTSLMLIGFAKTYWKHLAVVFLFLFCVWRVYSWGYDNAEAECERGRAELVNIIQQEKARRDQVVGDYEKKLLEAKPVKETIYRDVIREVEKPIYKECKIPDTGTVVLQHSSEKLNLLRKEQDSNPSAWKTLREKFKNEK